MQTLRRQHMVCDQVMQGLQRHGAGADLVGQGRQAEVDAFAGIAVPLPVQRLMRPILLEDKHCEQVGTGPATGNDMERRRRLGYLLAMAAGELLAHRLDHLPAARDHLQRLGYVLADLRQLVRAATRTGGRRGYHHALPRQMLGERLARQAAAGEALDLRRAGGRLFGCQLVLGRARLKLVKLEFHLVEKPLLALRTLTAYFSDSGRGFH